jgi:hypothetical protein
MGQMDSRSRKKVAICTRHPSANLTATQGIRERTLHRSCRDELEAGDGVTEGWMLPDAIP